MPRLPLATAPAAAALVVALAMAAPAAAQDTLPAPFGSTVRYAADSGRLDNPAGAWRAVFSHEVRIPGANSLRLHFAAAELPGGSYLLVTSMADGEQQRLDAATLDLWSSSTAYFNGDTLLLELHAAPNSAGGLVRIESLEAGFPEVVRGDPGQCGICNTDDRIPSNVAYAGRLMPVGCTASIICEDNTAITAGHCMTGSNVLQFNVPASDGACNLVNPPVADQFPVIDGSRVSANGGVGNDWGVFRLGVNTLGEGPFQRYGEMRPVAAAIPVSGSVIGFFGYGIDQTCVRNQIQQRSIGTISGIAATSFSFNADVRGGNSGSAVVFNEMVIGIVTHCSGSCGGNVATRIDQAALRAAINQTMSCDNRVRIRAAVTPGDAPLSVFVTVAPSDLNGAGNGITPFDRFYNPGANLSFTAPSLAGDLCFTGWQINGVNQGAAPTLAFPFAAPASVTARYGASACCSADWNTDGLVNSGDISAFLTSWLASVQAPDLVADFNNDGAVNSGDISAFLTAWLADVSGGC